MRISSRRSDIEIARSRISEAVVEDLLGATYPPIELPLSTIAPKAASPMPLPYPSPATGGKEETQVSHLPTIPPRFLVTEEAARFLALSGRTLEKHRTYGTGPIYRKLGGRIVYALSDLQDRADKGLRYPTSEPGPDIIHPARRHVMLERPFKQLEDLFQEA